MPRILPLCFRCRKLFSQFIPERAIYRSPSTFRSLSYRVPPCVRQAIDYGEQADLLADVPPERMVARGKAAEPLQQMIQNRGLKMVNLGNDLYPTADRARCYGLSQEALATIFWDGVNADYQKLQTTGESIQRLLASGKELHLTHPNGTDLRVGIEQRRAFVSDGVISDQDVQQGTAAT